MGDVPDAHLVPLQWAVQAMQRALERMRATGWNDQVGAFAAVGETLWWLVVVDSHLREREMSVLAATLDEGPDGTTALLAGLRFARNRISHGVDTINYVASQPVEAASFRAQWSWRALAPRAEGSNKGYEEYQRELAGRDVVETLLGATGFLGQVSVRVRNAD